MGHWGKTSGQYKTVKSVEVKSVVRFLTGKLTQRGSIRCIYPALVLSGLFSITSPKINDHTEPGYFYL